MLAASFALTAPGVLPSMQTASEPCFSAQYRRYRRFVGHALRRVGVPEADVDDLSQEVFVVLLRNMRELTETERLMPWLHQVARRVASNHRRGVLRRQRRQQQGAEPAELEDPEQALARAEAAEFLGDFFDQLDPEARLLFLLSEVEGLRGPEIAQQLRLNLDTTYSRIRAVRRRFVRAVDQQRESRAAWVAMLPALAGPSAGGPAWGPAGWLGVALRTTATQKLLGALLVVLVAVGLATLTRGSCSVQPEGADATPPLAAGDDLTRGGRATIETEGDASSRRVGAVVTGRVEDLAGAGVPRAKVCTAREAGASPRCVLADDRGVYSLPGMRPGAAWVGASARGYVAPPAFDGRPYREIRVPTTGTLAGIDLLLRPGGAEVSGLVRDMSGGPIEGATVVSLRGAELLADDEVITDADGRFSMWVDTTSFVRIVASAEGYVTEEQLLFHPAGQAFELALFPEAVIEGRVVDARTGDALADVVVEASRRGAEALTARTDARGRFRLTGLSPGRYKPYLHDGTWLGHATRAVALELGETTSDVVIEAHGARRLRGRAVREGERPCTEGRVTVRDASGEVASSQRPDPMGEVDIGGLLPGEYTVIVSCTMSWEGAPGPEFAVDLLDADVEDARWEVLEEHHGERAVQGSVVGPSGASVPFARLELILDGGLEDGGMLAPLTLSDREGRFSFEHLPAGAYRLYTEAEGFAAGTTRFEIAERDVAVEVELESGVDLRIQAKDPSGVSVPGVEVKVGSTVDQSSTWLKTNAEGWAEARDQRPGTHRIVVSRPGVGGRAGAEDPSRWDEGTLVDLEGDTEITVVVPARDGSIRGRALRVDGDPVADALVEARSSQTYLNFVGEPRAAVVAEARTDTEGNFVLEGLEADAVSVIVSDAFGQSASQDGVEPGAALTLELPEPGELHGTVEIEGEDPPELFTITVTPKAGDRYAEDFLRSDGRWSIVGVPPGPARVEVHSAWGTAQAKATVEAGGEAGPLTLRLAPRGSIRGRLVGADGQPRAGVHVVVLSDHGPATGAVGTSNAEGVFELAGAPSGSVVVKVIAPVGHRPKRIPTTVPPGTSVDLGAVTLEALAADEPEPEP